MIPLHMPLYANRDTQCIPNDVLHNRRAYTNGITPYVYWKNEGVSECYDVNWTKIEQKKTWKNLLSST